MVLLKQVILTTNVGSSSVKLSLYDLQLNLCWSSENNDPLPKCQIVAIGHRFVHGGDYTKPQLINRQVLKKLESLKELAPLHNPKCLTIIKTSLKLFPKVPQVVCFDTAFHTTLPSYAKTYAIPEKFHIKRYGFHGISHAYLAAKYAEYTKKRRFKIITLHLGSGCSLTAIRDGKSIETSMGFSPEEGLIMGTRAGDIDATLLEYLAKKTGSTLHQLTHMLNFESGLKGISKKSSDIRDLLKDYRKDPHCKLAVDMFCYRIVKYIGAYVSVLNGVDALIFSGGIGEHSSQIRQMICNQLKWLKVAITHKKMSQDVQKISTPSSGVDVYVIHTEENHFIAKETFGLIL